MKYTVWLFDDTYEVIDEEKIEGGIAALETAMFQKTPVYLNGKLIAGSSISRIELFGNHNDYGPHNMQLGSGFEKAAKLLESNRKERPFSERDRTKLLLTEEMRKRGGDTPEKRDYMAVQRLARRLHDDVKNWKVKRWDEFLEAHPKAFEELVDVIMETKEEE